MDGGIGETMDRMAEQVFAYMMEEGSVRILRCFCAAGRAEVPEAIQGCPVTEIGPYAFSEGMEPRDWEKDERDGKVQFTAPGWEHLPVLAGNRLEEVILPGTVRRTGAYSFYNCGHLWRLSFSDGLKDWGRGAFTGCHHIRRLEMRSAGEDAWALKEVLSELHEELEVIWSGSEDAWLWFPEYYEEGVENTPARILVTMVHGSGLYYRNCFHGRKFDFREYDARFPYAAAQERADFLVRMACGRLRRPAGLEEEAARAYRDYLTEHFQELACFFLDRKDTEGLEWVCREMRRGGLPAERLDDLISWTADRAFPAGMAVLMEFWRQRPARQGGRRRRLEL